MVAKKIEFILFKHIHRQTINFVYSSQRGFAKFRLTVTNLTSLVQYNRTRERHI